MTQLQNASDDHVVVMCIPLEIQNMRKLLLKTAKY